MTFNSYTFVIFLALVVGLHYLPFSWRIKKFNLLWASYIFYAAWNPPFVLLLWLSTIVDWFLGKWLDRAEQVARRRLLLIASLSVNLGLLAFFKYSGFMLENLTTALAAMNIAYQPAAPDIRRIQFRSATPGRIREASPVLR